MTNYIKPKINIDAADAQASRWSSAESVSTASVTDNMYYTSLQRKRGQTTSTPQIINGEGSSNSEMFLNSRDLSPSLSQNSTSKLSQTRQEYLKEIGQRSVEGRRELDLGLVSKFGITKRASVASNTSLKSGTSGTSHIAPDAYSPLFLAQNAFLPRDRTIANAWNRAHYETNPIVRNAINLHATYPISKLSIKCEDKFVEKFFNDMANRIDLQTIVQNTALEYWKIGEVFCYAAFDESLGEWDQIYQHNPDYIKVHASPIPTRSPSISLRPDPELQRIVTSADSEYARMREQLDPKIVHHVLRNENIPLDDFSISHLKNLASPYDVRGTSIIVSVWKDLMLYDKLRESKFVQADGMINPMTIVKVGTDGAEGMYPRAEEIESWRHMLESAQYDKDFKIVTHNAVDIQRIGFQGGILDTSNDFSMIIDNILMGLMAPKSIMTQDGATYASASVGLDVMRQRYNSFRTMMANWLEKKIFAPISEIQGFYKLENKTKRLIVPEIEWNHMTLYDLDNYIAHISTLVEKSKVSMRTLDRSLGLNRANENLNMREESIEAAIFAKEKEALASMSLAELRSLDPTKPIIVQEREKSVLPGSAPPSAEAPSDLMGGLGLPPMPDLGPPPGGEAPPTPPIQ